jgi:hypothetical protein
MNKLNPVFSLAGRVMIPLIDNRRSAAVAAVS